MSEKKKQPIQPTYTDEHGAIRFQSNKIVEFLLDKGGIDMNRLAVEPFPREDREQFAQLIGYSLSGFSELSYVTDQTYNAAQVMAEGEPDERDARIATLEEIIKSLKDGLRIPIAELYGRHPDDLD